MKPFLKAFSVVLGISSLLSCDRDAKSGSSGDKARVGYVLHVLNDFTQVIKKGAEDAGKDFQIDVQVQGPAGGNAKEAVGLFEGMVQNRLSGLAVTPMPGEVWVGPIKRAVEAGVPVLTANTTSPGSAASAWFGQDEFKSGVILATEVRKVLDADGKKEGKILIGICAPGVQVLNVRHAGFKKGMEGTGFKLSEAHNVTFENTTNYAAWENLAGANSDVVAIVGLCSMDIPNLAKLKVRTKAKWVIGGYDLNVQTLDGIKAGTVQVTVGQHPYLQGYLPVMAFSQHIKDKKPLVKGWIDVGTEVVTKANVDSIYGRETSESTQRTWYADYIKKNFSDLSAVAKPMP